MSPSPDLQEIARENDRMESLYAEKRAAGYSWREALRFVLNSYREVCPECAGHGNVRVHAPEDYGISFESEGVRVVWWDGARL